MLLLTSCWTSEFADNDWKRKNTFMASPALDFPGKWLTGNPADVTNVMGHVFQDYLQLSAADQRPVVSVFQVAQL